MSTALETYRKATAEARAESEAEATTRTLRVALTMMRAFGDKAEAIAWQISRTDRRFRLVAKAIKEARG